MTKDNGHFERKCYFHHVCVCNLKQVLDPELASFQHMLVINKYWYKKIDPVF